MYHWLNYFLTFWHNIIDSDIIFSLWEIFCEYAESKASTTIESLQCLAISVLNSFWKTKISFFIISLRWRRQLKFFFTGDNGLFVCLSNTIVADDLATQGPKASTAMVLHLFSGMFWAQSLNQYPSPRIFWAQSLNQSPSPRMCNTIIALRNHINFQRNKTKFYQIVPQIFRFCNIVYFFKLRVVWPFIRSYTKREISQAMVARVWIIV